MKILKTDINLEGLVLDETLKEMDVKEIFNKVVKSIILSYANKKRGLEEEERRKYYKIMDCLEGRESDKVKLEDDWFGFLRKCKREALLFPDMLLRIVEEKIDAVEYK